MQTMKRNKRSAVLLLALAVLLTAVVGATVAYVIHKTQSVTNTFAPSNVACQVQGENPYTVKNTGDTQCFIRVAVVVTVRNEGVISAVKPSYKVTHDANWVQGSDGYYYYTQSLAAGDTTASRLTVDAPDGCTVEIVASAIQNTAEAVKDWSSDVASIISDGTLAVKPLVTEP